VLQFFDPSITEVIEWSISNRDLVAWQAFSSTISRIEWIVGVSSACPVTNEPGVTGAIPPGGERCRRHHGWRTAGKG
jgi:hypothetical protein